MYNFFKNISTKSSCQSIGVCSVHPSVITLHEILLNEVKEISFYLVKLKELGFTNKSLMKFCIEVLSIFLINTSYNQTKYLNLLHKLHNENIQIKNKYVNYCIENSLPCAIINKTFEISDNLTVSDLIKTFEEKVINNQRNLDKTKRRLFELIKIFARLCAINILKIKKFDNNFDIYDFEILRFFSLINGYSIREEKIKRRILEFSNISLKILKKLFEIYEEKFGKKESIDILTTPQKGHCILVSGFDFDELENLLKTLEKNNIENVNVYTNGPLFLAHFYPFFKYNKFLKGHYGLDNAEYEFSTFPGSVLITQNFIKKIDNLYKGEIYSNKIISFDKFFDIQNNNMLPLINSALKFDGFNETKPEKRIKIRYRANEIYSLLSKFQNEKIIIVIGKMDEKIDFTEYKDKKIVTLTCLCEVDILVNAIEFLKEKQNEVTVFFSQCNLENLNILFSLLNQNIDIYLSECLYVLINPHAIESLKQDFKITVV